MAGALSLEVHLYVLGPNGFQKSDHEREMTSDLIYTFMWKASSLLTTDGAQMANNSLE
jgi:hypothetical protein